MAVHSSDCAENAAFDAFTTFFRSRQLPVPEVFSYNAEKGVTLQEDLGASTLLDTINALRGDGGGGEAAVQQLYERLMALLVRFQTVALDEFPLGYCTPRQHYDTRAARWDLQSFKYLFLRPLAVRVDEDRLEDEIGLLADRVRTLPLFGFMHRDFQSRNIMVRDGEFYCIDYQSGREGPLLYDVASSLYQGSARLSPAVRARALEVYLTELAKVRPIDKERVRAEFPFFVALFLLKVLGTYGLQGVTHRKPYFLKAIPLALQNLQGVLAESPVAIGSGYLTELVEELSSGSPRWDSLPA